ncbi:hypothetical protein F2P79_004408 [Pimephales promelas]|nr:hypothetical protein F2P79_004408 [Pimephales promelas]
MGKTADLTAVQKAIIDTLKQEVGSLWEGKTRRGDRTLRNIVEKDRFQTLGDLRKQWIESGVETSRATVCRKWATGAAFPSGCMLFGNQGARVWRKTGEKEMPKVQCQVPPHDLAPAHSAKTIGKWFTEHGITMINWPANSPDLNPNLWDIVKRKLRDARPNTLDELKAAIEASWASITPQQCHRLIAYMPRRIEAVISAKGFPTKY